MKMMQGCYNMQSKTERTRDYKWKWLWTHHKYLRG